MHAAWHDLAFFLSRFPRKFSRTSKGGRSCFSLSSTILAFRCIPSGMKTVKLFTQHPVFASLCLGAILLLSYSCSVPDQPQTQPTSPAWSEAVETYLNAVHANGQLNGSVLIAQGAEINFEWFGGFANRQFQVPITDSTCFLIGSITKTFTAYGILVLEHHKKLSLSDPLSTYFPDFPQSEDVTILQLLNHSSGIRDYHFFKDWKVRSKTDLTPKQVIDQVATNPFRFDPGTQFRYSNTGYILLGLIIEQVSGLSFEEYIAQAIVQPFQLQQTGVIRHSLVFPNLAEGYTSTPYNTHRAEYINYNQPFASGNLYSSPRDLWKFTRSVLESRLISPEKTKLIFTPGLGSYGLGWGIRDFNGTKAYGHRGAMNGFTGSITYLPDSNIFIAVLSNDDCTPIQTTMRDVVALLGQKEVPLPASRQPIALTDSLCSLVVGDYLIKTGDTLRVFQNESSLFLQETNQEQHEMFPTAAGLFIFARLELTVLFSELKNGKSDLLELKGKTSVIARRIQKVQAPS